MRDTPLITAAALAQRLASGAEIVLLDARPGARDYVAGHLASARHADLEAQLSAAHDAGSDPRLEGRHPLPPLDRWCRQLGAWGIGPDTAVVIHDDQAGANAAARAWWMLRALGHSQVQVLDGGLQAALAVGLRLETDAPEIAARAPYPATHWQWPLADIDRVDALRRDPRWKLLDVRAAARYRGDVEPLDPVAGHIPGALNLPYSENLLADGHFKSPAALREQYLSLLGDALPSQLVVHCGSGVTACHSLLALAAAGLEGASLYVGSWSQWCRSGRPLGRSPS